MSHILKFRAAHLAWLPAALLISAGVLSVIGVSLTPNGRAATATGTTNISATVLPEISLDLGQDAGGLGAACGTYVSGTVPLGNEVHEFGNAGARISIPGSGSFNLGTCNMTFGTNNGVAPGASLSYKSARITTGGRTFCTAAANANCAGANTYYTDDDGTNNTLEADKFGVRLTTENCDTVTPSMTVGNYYGAPLAAAAAQDVCTSETTNASAAQDGHVVMSFDVNTSTVASGNYNAQLVFTATAN